MSGGGSADLLRRWTAALLAVPPAEREGVIEAIEQRVAELYPAPARPLHLVQPPVQRAGYVEQTIRTYDVVPDTAQRAPLSARTRPAPPSGPRRSA